MTNLEDLLASYNLEEKILEEIKKKGVSILPIPKFEGLDGVEVNEAGEPIIPVDLPELTLTQLGNLSGACNAYLNFLSVQLIISKLEMETYDELRKLLWAKLRSEKDGKKDDKDDYVRGHPQWVRVNAEYLLKKSVYEILAIKYDRLQGNMKTISRELSRRCADIELEKLDNRRGDTL